MTILISLYGLLIGSFLNVCIYRIPREESIVFPSSHCPSCNTKLRWYDNIPLVSYLSLMGKCRYCGGPISPQYPIVELLNAFLYIIIYLQFGFSFNFIFFAIIFSILIVIGIIDLKEMIIPDVLVLLIMGITVVYKLLSYILYNSPPDIPNSIGGLVLSSLLFVAIIFLSKGGMGEGDVTLIASLGFILGVKYIFLTIFLSFILGAIISILLLLFKIKGKKDPIPFGPFIILGFMITVYWGEQLLNWYISNFFRGV
ncbi:MAG: prepilin peptidase [Tissierellaceae bacterium]|nr:prepilin peptidase [Tissierellaceae bacterium]